MIVVLVEPKTLHLIASLPLELIDRWLPSIACHNSLLGSRFTLETNAMVGCASVQTREWWLLYIVETPRVVTLVCSKSTS